VSRGAIVTSHSLRTESRSHIQAIDLAWDAVLQFDRGEWDRRAAGAIIDVLSRERRPSAFVGRRDIADYLTAFAPAEWCPIHVTVDADGPLTSRQVAELAPRTADLPPDTPVFLCLVDRYDAHLLTEALPGGRGVLTLDVLKELLGEHIPAFAWRETFDHIYPIALPSIEIREGLDVLLLDLPARSIAQLPIGFAYVYKAVKETGLNVQGVDVDVIAYHRYHARRCMNLLRNLEIGGRTHPEDPWLPEHYLVWTDRNSVECFAEILDEVADQIVRARPKCLGFSLHQTSHVAINYVVERVRHQLPDICVIVGGMSCYQHIVAGRIFPLADYVVVGEADTVIGPLVMAIASGERPRDIPGVVSRDDTPDREFIAAPLPHNLDVVGRPDYGFTDMELYVNWNRYRLMPLVGTRGCGWSRCTFCAERFNWRARTPEMVAAEIEDYTRQGFRSFVFNESDFNSNRSFVIRLCNEIVRRGIKGTFTAQLRIGKDCDFEYYKAMADAGFRCLRFGVDALSDNTLRLQRKGYTKQMVLDNLKHCHDLGIYTEINVVIGVPGETDADVEESADFLIEMKPYIGRVAFINPLMLFVGSVYYFEPEAHKIRFVGDKDVLYRTHFVALPDNSWYSEEPYIDHQVRTERFFRLVERIRDAGVPLGAFANFTASRRKTHRGGTGVEAGTDDLASPATPVEPSQPRVMKVGEQFYLATEPIVEFRGVMPTYAAPRLLRSYQGYNLVGYRDQILAAPLVLGRIDLTQPATATDLRILKARTEDEACHLIDIIGAATAMMQEAALTRELEQLAEADARAHKAESGGLPVEDRELATAPASRNTAKLNMGAGVLMRWGK
jgi:radical SAM superfamily enzyme YgiQ (UPF0313 family)